MGYSSNSKQNKIRTYEAQVTSTTLTISNKILSNYNEIIFTSNLQLNAMVVFDIPPRPITLVVTNRTQNTLQLGYILKGAVELPPGMVCTIQLNRDSSLTAVTPFTFDSGYTSVKRVMTSIPVGVSSPSGDVNVYRTVAHGLETAPDWAIITPATTMQPHNSSTTAKISSSININNTYVGATFSNNTGTTALYQVYFQ